MKNIFFTGLIIFLTGCSSKQQKPHDISSVKATSGEMILIGKINKANLQVSPLTPWFNQDYQRISIDTKWIESVKPYLKGLSVKIFMPKESIRKCWKATKNLSKKFEFTYSKNDVHLALCNYFLNNFLGQKDNV